MTPKSQHTLYSQKFIDAPAEKHVLHYVGKRILDMSTAAILLVVLAPLFVIIALCIVLDSPGPVLFVQERVGARRSVKNGKTVWQVRTFPFYKFRSMVHNADQSIHEAYIKSFIDGQVEPAEQTQSTFKLTNDPRVTRVGRFLRETSLDELPQLLNVLRGEMSLVGPRPVPTYEVAGYQDRHFTRLAALGHYRSVAGARTLSGAIRGYGSPRCRLHSPTIVVVRSQATSTHHSNCRIEKGGRMKVQQSIDDRPLRVSPDRPIGVAIIGCGYWGINYVRVFQELTRAMVVVVCDQNAERLHEVKRRFPEVQVMTDLDTALRMEGVDAAVVCTPATTHFEVTRRCLAASKHVLIEKPITNTVEEADRLTSQADSKGVTLMVGHTFLYNPAITKVKEYIQRGDIGRLYYLYSRRTNMGPIRHDVNALWDLAPHDVSIFNYLLNSTPDWISAVGAKVLRNGLEDVGFISLGYAPDIVAHIHVSWTDAYKVREVVAVGSEKRIVFNEFNPLERVRVFDKGVSVVEPEAATYGEYQLQMRDGDIISPRIDASEPLKNQCLHFLDCINNGRRPLTDGWMGREVIRVMRAIDRSVENRGAPVELKLSSQMIGTRH